MSVQKILVPQSKANDDWGSVKFYYQNSLSSLTASSTSSDTGTSFDVDNIYDMIESTQWKSNVGVSYIDFDAGSTITCDYAAFNGHNFNTESTTLELRSSTSSFSAPSFSFTERSNPKNVQLNSVAYGASVFVAVGESDGIDSYIISSSDGTTWTERSGNKSIALNGVTFGGGLFVAVGDYDGVDSLISTSPDGITWTERSTPSVENMHGVTYGNGLYVAVGANDGTDSTIYTSSDAITWTERSCPVVVPLYSVAYGNGLFVAVGQGGTVIKSSDGITWTVSTSGIPAAQLEEVVFSGRFIAVGLDDGSDATIITSLDAITWIEQTTPKAFDLNSITADPYGGLIAVGQADGTDSLILTSLDGESWTEVSNAKNFDLNGAASNFDGTSVFVGDADGTDAYMGSYTETPGGDEVFSGYQPTTDNSIVKEFSSTSARYWRLYVYTQSLAPTISIGIWGELTELDFATATFDPYRQKDNATVVVSETGYVTGVYENYIERQIIFNFSHAEDELYRKVKDWWESSGRNNIFVNWESIANTSDIFLMRPDDAFNNPLLVGGKYRTIAISLKGRKE